MSRKIIGLDIQDDAISAILVKSGFKGYWIEDYVTVPISEPNLPLPSPLADEVDDDNEAEENLPIPGIFTALETLCSKIDTAGSVCIASLPANLVCYRNIQLPFKDTKRIRQTLPFELEPTLPFFIDDLIIDFHVISNHKKTSDAKNNTEIIAAAVEQSRLKIYLDTLKAFNLDPEMITLRGYPTALCLAKFADVPENWLFADIFDNKCTIFAVASGQLCLIRSFPIRLTPEHRVSSFCENIQRTLAAVEEIFCSEFQVEQIYFSGESPDTFSEFENFEQKAEHMLDIPVRQVELVRYTGAKRKSSVIRLTHELNSAFALALMEIEGIDGLNFRRGPFAASREWAEHKGSLIKTAMLMILVVAAVFLNMMIDLHSMEKRINELDSQITGIFKSTFPDINRIVDPVHQMRVAMDDLKKTDLLPGETEKNVRAIDIINDISSLVSKNIDVELTQLIVSQDNIQISGNTNTFNAVDDMQNQLEKSKIFQKVTIASTNKERSGNRIQFKMKMQL